MPTFTSGATISPGIRALGRDSSQVSTAFNNSYMLDCMKAHPRVLSAVATLDNGGSAPAGAMGELARKGVRGFRIVPGSAPDTWLDAPGMQAMWVAGAKRRLAMYPLINSDVLPGIDRMCTKYPDTPIAIDHLARIGADGQIRDSDVRLLCGLALGKKQAPYTDLAPLIRRVFEDYGPRRLWASDYPYQVQNGHAYRPSISLVRERLPFLSAEHRNWILGKTAASVNFYR